MNSSNPHKMVEREISLQSCSAGSEKNNKLKVLFAMRSVKQIHGYKSIISGLCDHGHAVRVVFDTIWSPPVPSGSRLDQVNEIMQGVEGFSCGWQINRSGRWNRTLLAARELLSYIRYLKIKEQSRFYLTRWERYLPQTVRKIVSVPGVKLVLKNKLVEKSLKLVEKKMPADTAIVNDIRQYNPDVVIGGPVNMRNSGELDYIKAAVELGIPTALPVISWDNLTTKGLIHIIPDIVMVWNDMQAREAVAHHKVPTDQIRTVGSWVFDVWFSDLKPSMTREEFCARHSLNPELPIITYLGSSTNIAKDETWLIRDLRKALDKSDDKLLNSVQMIIRPHPANTKIYQDIESENIVVFPKEGAIPESADKLQLFFDTLHYSVTTVGINTSGMLDAIIANKPVISVLTERYEKTQKMAQHFHHLLENDVLELADSPEEFIDILKALMSGIDKHKDKREAFIRRAIRPRGIDISPGEVVALEIERLIYGYSESEDMSETLRLGVHCK